MSTELDKHIEGLIATAKRRKANVKRRLADMGRGENRFPSRGPINRYGGYCIRWHYWHNARERHKRLGRLIKEMIAWRRTLGKEEK